MMTFQLCNPVLKISNFSHSLDFSSLFLNKTQFHRNFCEEYYAVPEIFDTGNNLQASGSYEEENFNVSCWVFVYSRKCHCMRYTSMFLRSTKGEIIFSLVEWGCTKDTIVSDIKNTYWLRDTELFFSRKNPRKLGSRWNDREL